MPTDSKVVAVAFDLNFRHAAEIYTGVVDYTRESRLDWQLVPLNFGFEAQLMDLARSGRLHGAIGTFVSDRWVEGLTQQAVAAVNLFHFSEIRAVPTVSVDDSKLGSEAAKHLLDHGARQLAFLGAEGLHATRLRETAFRQQAGPKPIAKLTESGALDEALIEMLKNPRPLGIYCTSDRLARYVIRAALRLDLQFGKDLLVLGTDNEPSESVFAGIAISSIRIPAREIGKEAARLLAKQFEQEPVSPGTVPATESLLGDFELITRTSSLPHGRARVAQRAANFMDEHLDLAELDVNLLARETGASRRGLEIAFQSQFRTSPYRYLVELRLTQAKQLLRTTNLPIAEVGRRCGYPEPHHFSAWFKKQTGKPPKAARRALGLAPSE